MKIVTILAAAVILAGCAHVKFADGERVAIEHDNYDMKPLQAQADEACRASGGKTPAVLVSNLPVHNNLPAALLRHTATYRCAG